MNRDKFVEVVTSTPREYLGEKLVLSGVETLTLCADVVRAELDDLRAELEGCFLTQGGESAANFNAGVRKCLAILLIRSQRPTSEYFPVSPEEQQQVCEKL